MATAAAGSIILFVAVAPWHEGDLRAVIPVPATGSTAAASVTTSDKPYVDGKAEMLNLAPFYKIIFAQLSGTHVRYTDILGQQVIDGVPLKIEGNIVLYGQTLLERGTGDSRNNPRSVPGIVVGRKFDELHLVHNAAWPDLEGRRIATVTLRYVDGTAAEWPIIYGGNVRQGMGLPSEEKEALTDPGTKIFWRGPGPGSEELHAGYRLFKSTFQNPQPEKEVKTIEVSSAGEPFSSYSLLAATVTQHDPKRITTPPLPYTPGRAFEGRLIVRVLETKTHLPVADVLVMNGMTVEGVSVVAAPVFTNENGEAVIRYPEATATKISFTTRKEGRGRSGGQWHPGEGGVTLELMPLK